MASVTLRSAEISSIVPVTPVYGKTPQKSRIRTPIKSRVFNHGFMYAKSTVFTYGIMICCADKSGEISAIMKRAVMYLRVSTLDQTTANQERELRQVAERAGWEIMKVYKDHGISGAKGRDKRPAFDALQKAAARR